ncbi:hypothetical protein [Falsiruegeria mediterranea]|uniref:Uncharacterized protein n=1 Tax=Falsiruegeria mediterranea M17 TaxID=1200281 RepID=A0A2R8CAL7_9RHOB|nr:hypothetical protein [Falsiruegeria mediterranea]SPJ29408.1 hypothetical protein TRM7615_02926 [Falsiruegeria mediterranea M17]
MTRDQEALPDLEFLALQAIQSGRALAKNWREILPKVDGMTHAKIGETLIRLDEGEVFSIHDEHIWPKMKKALVKDLNEHRDGYGSYALETDTSYDDLWDRELEKKRWLMECWKAFMSARQMLIDRRRAAQIAAFFAG